MDKKATLDHPVHPLFEQRWSPRAYADTPVTDAELHSILEAARWAPSCFNEQPWRFIVVTRGQRELYDAFVACLSEGNQKWAPTAPVLLLSVASTHFARNGKPNRTAQHDVGLATGQLVLQAESLGLAARQMAGFDADRARALFEIPEGFDPVAAIALGRPGDPGVLDEVFQAKERSPRVRRPQSEFVIRGKWGAP